MHLFTHASLIVLLTLLTQLGGLAWLAALIFRKRLLAFVLGYALLWAAALVMAPLFGRVPLSCTTDGPLQMRSWVFCLTNRNYMTPELRDALTDTATALNQDYPGTPLQVLDASFPFVTGFPLLPHLSHDDGEKADVALLYRRDGTYAPGFTPSPVGYFAFEPGPTHCPPVWPSLRWDLDWLQPLWPDHSLDADRTSLVLRLLARDTRITRIFIEPHLKARLGVQGGTIGFQGCRAARHDDHIHVQL